MPLIISSDRGALTNALSAAGLPIPETVVEADKTATATAAHLERVRTEAEPNLSALTADNVDDIAREVALFNQKAAREEAAVIVNRHAENTLDTAWMQALDQITTDLREPFDKAALQFTKSLATLDGNTDPGEAVRAGREKAYRSLTAAHGVLSTLARARDVIASFRPTGIGHRDLDRLGRILDIPDMETVSRRLPLRVDGASPLSIDWFARVSQLPGVRIRWALPVEQLSETAIPAYSTTAA